MFKPFALAFEKSLRRYVPSHEEWHWRMFWDDHRHITVPAASRRVALVNERKVTLSTTQHGRCDPLGFFCSSFAFAMRLRTAERSETTEVIRNS